VSDRQINPIAAHGLGAVHYFTVKLTGATVDGSLIELDEFVSEA
jgi:hypothetical protein